MPAVEKAFCELKKRFTSAPILCRPDPSREFILEVDALDGGVGACSVCPIDEVQKVGSQMPFRGVSRSLIILLYLILSCLLSASLELHLGILSESFSQPSLVSGTQAPAPLTVFLFLSPSAHRSYSGVTPPSWPATLGSDALLPSSDNSSGGLLWTRNSKTL